MKSIRYILLISACCFISNEGKAEINLTFNFSDTTSSNTTLHTHTPNVELKPIFNLKYGIKLAAVCALAKGGCDDLNVYFNPSAACIGDGYKSSCPTGTVPDTSLECPYDSTKFKCKPCSDTCSEGSLTPCNSEQIETEVTLNECDNACYKCRDKTCEEGGFASSITSCQKSTTVPFAGKTCFHPSIQSKTCADKGSGWFSSIPENNYCSSNSYYCGNTCYSGCFQPTCIQGGFEQNIPPNNICTPVTYWGRSCYDNCYRPTCEGGGYKSSIPANNSCSSKSHYGQTCYYNCVNTCPNKGDRTSCPVGYVCTLEACSSKFYISGCAVNYTNYCTQPEMNCATLGYDKSSCPNEGIKCPYDISKMACK